MKTPFSLDQLKRLTGDFWPELFSAIAPLIVYWQIIFGGQVLYWGLPSLQFVPWRILVNEAFRQGHLPLWTPLLGMGAPVLANYQSAALYPPNWLSLILPPEIAISVLAVLHLSLAGLGMARLARRAGLNPFGVALCGLSFGLSGYLTGRLWFITINNALAWLPWVVLYCLPHPAEKTYTHKRFLILSILLTLQLLSGHAQSAFYTILLVLAWITWHSIVSGQRSALSIQPSNFQRLISNLSFVFLALLFAISLAALQLIPTYELLRLSPRATAAEYDFATTYSLWPWRLATFIVPNLFGHPADHNFWGYATFWEDNAYLGLLPLIFALYVPYYLARNPYINRRQDRVTKLAPQQSADPAQLSHSQIQSYFFFSALLITASLILALGKRTPVFPFFYQSIPGFSLFQAPARMLIWYTFGLSLLVGIGAHLWQASDRKRYWSRLGIAGSLAMLVLGVAGAVYLKDPRTITFGTGLVWAAAFGFGSFVLILLQNSSPKWQWATLLFVTVDLGLAAVRATPITDRTLYQIAPSLVGSSGRLYQYAGDEYRVKFNELLRFNSFDPLDPQAYRTSWLTNLNVLSNIPSANNFDPLITARYSDYINVMEQSPRLLDLADVTAIVKPMGAVSIRSGNPNRLRIIYSARTVDSSASAMAVLRDPAFDPNTEIILEPQPGFPDLSGLALDPNRYTQPVTLDQAGYVILSDTYYPGWRVLVDDVPQPLLLANVNFRAVAVPAGTHTVTFEYAPLSVTIGLIISISGLLVWLILVVGHLYAKRPTSNLSSL